MQKHTIRMKNGTCALWLKFCFVYFLLNKIRFCDSVATIQKGKISLLFFFWFVFSVFSFRSSTILTASLTDDVFSIFRRFGLIDTIYVWIFQMIVIYVEASNSNGERLKHSFIHSYIYTNHKQLKIVVFFKSESLTWCILLSLSPHWQQIPWKPLKLHWNWQSCVCVFVCLCYVANVVETLVISTNHKRQTLSTKRYSSKVYGL